MANFFGRSTDGSNSDNGSTWALAKADVNAGLALASAGDTVYISDNHNAPTVSGPLTYAAPAWSAGTAPVRILCVDDAGDPSSPTALATTAIDGSGNAISFSGYAYAYGITFQDGTGSSNLNMSFATSNLNWEFDHCVLKIATTGSGSRINIGNNGFGASTTSVILRNTNISFANAAQAIQLRGAKLFLWEGGALAGTVPTGGLFQHTATGGVSRIVISGVDLSSLGSNPILSLANDGSSWFYFDNCKLGSSFAPTSGSFGQPTSSEMFFTNCASDSKNYRFMYRGYLGSIDEEATIVHASAGSDGTTPISIKMASSANTSFHMPLRTQWIPLWNETTGAAVTLTLKCVNDGSTLTDAEAWIETKVLATSGFPMAVFASDAKADTLATAANQASDSDSWTTSGLGSPIKQALGKAQTPQLKGLMYGRVCLAKASTTLYVNGKIVVT